MRGMRCRPSTRVRRHGSLKRTRRYPTCSRAGQHDADRAPRASAVVPEAVVAATGDVPVWGNGDALEGGGEGEVDVRSGRGTGCGLTRRRTTPRGRLDKGGC